MHLLFFWSRSLVLLNKSRILLNKSQILLNKSRILILHPHFSGPFGANDYLLPVFKKSNNIDTIIVYITLIVIDQDNYLH